MNRPYLTAAACLTLLVSCIAPAWALTPPVQAPSPGSLVIVGGALSAENGAVFRAILQRKLQHGPLCVLPTASQDPVKSANSYVRDFERYGGDGVAVAVNLTTRSAEHALDPQFADQLRGCGGFFFTGGDQSRIVDVLRPGGNDSPAATALREAYARGAVISGSSAGAAMMSDPMIGGGDSREALRHGVTGDESGRGVWVRQGMGFLDRGLTGQHFLARGRMGRLLVALAAYPDERVGIGVDEDTAAIVEGDRLSVVGASQVAVVLADAPAGTAETFSGTLVLLGDGDGIDLRTGDITRGTDKAPAPIVEKAPNAPSRPFRDERLHRFLLEFAAAPSVSTARLRSGQAMLTVRKREGCGCWIAPDDDAFPPRGAGAGPFAFELEHPGRKP